MEWLIDRFGWKLLFFPLTMSALLFLGAMLLLVTDEPSKPAGEQKAAVESTKKEKPTGKTAKQKTEVPTEKKTEQKTSDTTNSKEDTPKQNTQTPSDKDENKNTVDKADAKSEEKASTDQPKLPTTFKDGTYIAGSNIMEGEYLVWQKDKSPSLEVKDQKGSSIVNMTFHNRTYITVPAGCSITLQQCDARLSNEAQAYKLEGTYYPEGQYLCGKDITEGKYVVRPNKDTKEGSYSICEDSTGSLASISQSQIITDDKVVTVNKGQYITLTGLEMKPVEPKKSEDSETSDKSEKTEKDEKGKDKKESKDKEKK